MTLLQISVLLLFVIVNGPGVDSTCMTDEMARKEENQRYDTLIKRFSQLTAQSETINSKMKERLSKIEVEQKEQKELLKEQKELLQSVLGRFDLQDNYTEESRKERPCDAAQPLSYIPYQADLPKFKNIPKFKNCPMNPYLVGSEWIVFQRRISGRLSFNRAWQAYKDGFGSRHDELWLGLEPLHQITKRGTYELRVVITYNGSTEYAHYSSFSIAGRSDDYRLSIGAFVGGKAGDGMSYSNKMKFSTPYRDNDLWSRHCGDYYSSGWWFKWCQIANLNGLWGKQNTWQTALWRPLTGYNSASFTEMKIRRVN